MNIYIYIRKLLKILYIIDIQINFIYFCLLYIQLPAANPATEPAQLREVDEDEDGDEALNWLKQF